MCDRVALAGPLYSQASNPTAKCHRRLPIRQGMLGFSSPWIGGQVLRPSTAQLLQACTRSVGCGTRGFRNNRTTTVRMEAASDATAQQETSGKRVRRERRKGEAYGPLSIAGSLKPVIQWYPGHIAKAERRLRDAMKLVDVVIEVRDCRIPFATAHPEVSEWVGSRPRVLAMNRADLVPDTARSAWREHLMKVGEKPRFINAKQGRGVNELKKLALHAGSAVNEKRKRRGLLPRAVRCLVIGYPNVGKSALINRLVDRRAAKSANKPGVTRNFQWVRMSKDIELLDMPGIIPAKFVSQETALRLAFCDDIGQAAYDNQVTASLLLDELKHVSQMSPGFVDLSILSDRFKTDPFAGSGEDFLVRASERLYQGDAERTALRLLKEFRSGDLGPVALEWPTMKFEPAAQAEDE